MSTVYRVFGDSDIWNVGVDDGDEDFSLVSVTQWSGSRFEVAFTDDGDDIRVVFAGEFSASGTPATLGQVSGLVAWLEVFANGSLEEYRSWDSGFDIQHIVHYDQAAELAALVGDDLFQGAPDHRNNDAVQGREGNDVFIGYGDEEGSWGDIFYGGPGVDISVYRGNLSDYQVQRTDYIYDLRVDDGSYVAGISVRDGVAGRDGYDQLNEVERLQFNDVNLAFDIDGLAGQAYRLYKAAFNRQPDEGGLGYWINELDQGFQLWDVASGFLASAEFIALYGDNAPDREFINALYQNVFHREADQAGFDYWEGELANGYNRENILLSFSESAENQANVISLIADGIRYESWDPIGI